MGLFGKKNQSKEFKETISEVKPHQDEVNKNEVSLLNI